MPTIILPNTGLMSGENATIHVDEYRRMSITETLMESAYFIAPAILLVSFQLNLTQEVMYKLAVFLCLAAGAFGSAIFFIAWTKRKQSNKYYLVNKDEFDRAFNNQIPQNPKDGNMRLQTQVVPKKTLSESKKTLECYVNLCIFLSRAIMVISGVRLRQYFHDDMPAAKGLSEEWAGDLEQQDDSVRRAIDATYMMKSAATFALRYGFISRIIAAVIPKLGFRKNQCECCGQPKEKCNGVNSTNKKSKIEKYF